MVGTIIVITVLPESIIRKEVIVTVTMVEAMIEIVMTTDGINIKVNQAEIEIPEVIMTTIVEATTMVETRKAITDELDTTE
jgi:hypothetical protein